MKKKERKLMKSHEAPIGKVKASKLCLCLDFVYFCWLVIVFVRLRFLRSNSTTFLMLNFIHEHFCKRNSLTTSWYFRAWDEKYSRSLRENPILNNFQIQTPNNRPINNSERNLFENGISPRAAEWRIGCLSLHD